MALLVARYQILIKNQSGVQVALLDDYRSLQFQKTVNDVGFFTLTLDYNSSFREFFEFDGQIEVKRKIPGVRDWYTEFEGHIENFNTTLFSNSNFQFVVVGSGYNGLLKRRHILWLDDSVQAEKNAAAETAMKEYVDENCTANALAASGRLIDGEIAGLSIEIDNGNGSTWQGDRAGKNLLLVLQEIANFSQIDFDVIGIGNALYEFRTYVDQIGDDLTTDELDPTTGLNGAGNAPFIFDPARGNVQQASLQQKHRSEANVVAIYGRGQGATRDTAVESNVTAIELSPINQRETMRGGSSQSQVAQLSDLAQEWLERLQTVEKFNFVPQDTAASLYGVHYNFGDKVTAKLGDFEADKRITSITINLAGGRGESSKSIQFTDIPRK